MSITRLFNRNITSKEATREFANAFVSRKFGRAKRLLETGVVDPNFVIIGAHYHRQHKLSDFEAPALYRAAELEQYDIAKALLKAGAQVDMPKDPQKPYARFGNQTPLHRSVVRGNTRMVKLFLDHGAVIDLQDALDHAARNNYKDIKLLLVAAIQKQSSAKAKKPAASQALRA